jgi:outer membrane biogenesis lipoprotein LolB
MALLLQLTQKLAHGFSGFWVRWPRKVAKLEAQKAWQQAQIDEETDELIQKALDWQVPIFERRDPERIPHAATWIRGRRWDDEPPPTPKPSQPTVDQDGRRVIPSNIPEHERWRLR